jgi:hypothetical protein
MMRKPKIIDKNKPREKIQAKNKNEPKGGKALWWKLQDEWHTEVFALLEYLDQNQPYRALLNRYFRAVFRNRPAMTESSMRTAQSMGLPSDRLLLNVGRAVISTKKNRVAKNNGRTRFMTNGADYETRERAGLLEKYCAGLDYQQDTHGSMKRMFTDEEVCGTGCVKVYDDDDEVVTEYVDIDRIVVDEEACVGGKTYELHDRVWMSREMVLEEYADILGEEEIMKAPSDERRSASSGVVSDRIQLVESFKLPFHAGGESLHTVSIKTASWSEEWKHDKFPYAFFRGETTEGFYGEGSMERGNPLSIELQQLLRTAHLGIKLGSVHRYHVNDESEVVDSEINNDVGSIVHWSGAVPVTKEVSNSVPSEVWQQIDWLYQMYYRLEGVSEQSAAARKEKGIDAAVALREQADMEADRMSILSQDFEWARVHINELQIEAARRIHERKGEYKVQFPLDGDGYLEIDFGEVDLKRNQFIMQPYPASSLPQTPSARAQWIEERMSSQLITPEIGRKLMNMPDIDREMSMLTAAERDVDRTLDHMMKAKNKDKSGLPVYLSPEIFQNLPLALERATLKYLSLRLIPGVPEDRLDLLRRFAKAAFDLNLKRKALENPAPAPGLAPAAPPMEQPAMPAGPAVAPPGMPPM